jgi:hypothetical protein
MQTPENNDIERMCFFFVGGNGMKNISECEEEREKKDSRKLK